MLIAGDLALALSLVDEVHAEVDLAVQPLVERHARGSSCGRGCARCCADELSVLEIEAEKIQRDFPHVAREQRAGPQGGCAFLGPEGECRVYASRPYICRTQGLPLRWYLEDEHEEIVEERALCELNRTHPPLDGLPEEALWLLGPSEARLVEAQLAYRPGPIHRVRLRTLFDPDPKRG